MNGQASLQIASAESPAPGQATILEAPRRSIPSAGLPERVGAGAGRARKRSIVTAIAFATVAAVAWFGWQYWLTVRYIETTDNAYLKADIINIAPQVAGQVAEVPVQDNQSVQFGDVLVKLDDRTLQTALARAQADVSAAEAALANLDERARLQPSRIAAAQADVLSNSATLDYAQSDSQRYRALSQTGAASMQRNEESRATFQRAMAAVAKTKADLTLEQQQVNVLTSERAQRAADLQRARASLQSAQIDLANTVIRAPRAGVVGNRGVRTGQYVKVGQTTLNVVPVRDIYVIANFKETQLERMRAGMPARIRVDLLGGRTLTGRVESLAPAAGAEFAVLPPDNATGNFTKIVQRIPVRIAVTLPDELVGLLRPGASVEAQVDTAPSGSAERGPLP